MDRKGFVAIFNKDLDRALVSDIITSWLERFERLEQVIPNDDGTLEVKDLSELMWEQSPQFRITNGDCFAWVYLTLDKRAIETTGLQDGEISFCLEVLLELPNVAEIIDEKNQRRLDELEKAGII